MDNPFDAVPVGWDSAFATPYRIELLNWPELSGAARASLETKFAAYLEEQFGGPQGVKAAFMRHEELFEEYEAKLGPDCAAFDSEWDRAMKAAMAAALEGVNAPPAATFWPSLYDAAYDRPFTLRQDPDSN
jgi:hypothetical protein